MPPIRNCARFFCIKGGAINYLEIWHESGRWMHGLGVRVGLCKLGVSWRIANRVGQTDYNDVS